VPCCADRLLLLVLCHAAAAAALAAAGESQAEWFAEGLLERLVDKNDAVTRHLLRDAIVYVMPNVCPDGTWRGHLRTNAAGRNLNREWEAPCEDESPEVYHLLKMMDREGE
jgi:murein tripeptide amidase MpaA